MAYRKEKFATRIWQDYTGATWNNLKLANTRAPSGDTSYCYVQGSGSKTQYKPKSVFYHFKITGFNEEKYRITGVTWTVTFGRKTSTKTNDLPSLKVFSGDDNAPYKKDPIFKTSSYTLNDNTFDFDTYTVKYTLKGITFAHLKNLICELDWKKTKTSHESVVSINRSHIIVYYEKKNPKWSMYSSVNTDYATTNEKVAWKVTVKNTGGICADDTIKIVLPKNVSLVSSSGKVGSFNKNTMVWSIPNLCSGKSATRTFYVKSKTIGQKQLQAVNLDTQHATNVKEIQLVTFRKPIVIPSFPQNNVVSRDDKIIFHFYDTFAKEHDQYFDVEIHGMRENHGCPSTIACYPIRTSSNVRLKTPVSVHAELLDDENNVNVLSIESSGVADNILCLNINCDRDFIANVRIWIDYITDDSQFTVGIENYNGQWVNGSHDILPMRGTQFDYDGAFSRDKMYVTNSINVGSIENWTIISKSHKQNFFDEIKDTMSIEIEEMIAYIGVVPLKRAHKADVTASVRNSLIENRYLNRAYYGKKGDYSEDIEMTLRMPWYDVATLEGLVEMDKPIPIDTCPELPDGDPLNHRGWAEIHGVHDIRKINDMLYECKVDVTYLNHDIITKFKIKEAQKVTTQTIQHYLSLVHDYNEEIREFFSMNYYQFWTTLEDEFGNKTGSYEIEPNSSLILSRDLNKYSTYDFIWRNKLPETLSEDYDGNWEMAIQIWDKTNNKMLFEHAYTDYLHYDYDMAYPVNTANATTKYLNGKNYEIINIEKISLGYDELSPLIEDRKIPTHFNTMETTATIEELGSKFEIFLLDNENKGVKSKPVIVNIKDNLGFTHTFNVMTDIWGRVLFDPRFGNGDYDVKLTFKEDATYRSCTYETSIKVNIEEVQCHFNYPKFNTFLNVGSPFYCILSDSNGNGLSNFMLHYSFKEASGDYGYERTVITGTNGVAEIPIDYVNGTVKIRVAMKGFEDNNIIYQPVQFEEELNINVK